MKSIAIKIGNKLLQIGDKVLAFRTPEPLTFTAVAAADVSFTKGTAASEEVTLQYNKNEAGWQDYTFGDTISLAIGDKVSFQGNNETFSGSLSTEVIRFVTTAKVAASGNVMSLIDSTEYTNTVPAYCFHRLFAGAKITTAPKLPATTLNTGCYKDMFNACTNLTEIPNLPANTLAANCYENMFYGCTGLVSVGTLPAMNLAEYCYKNMFQGCASLTTAPTLPATTMANYCYQFMFQSCSKLVNAPALPATTLADYCYAQMFQLCSKLANPPTLSATQMKPYCYYSMFYKCTSLTTPPALPATTLSEQCYNGMFQYSGITSTPVLSVTTLATGCYQDMFKYCNSLTDIPTLPAINTVKLCYSSMFYGCEGLTTIDISKIAMKNITDSCCRNMFRLCKGLISAPAISVNNLATFCFANMFQDCTSITTAGNITATTMSTDGGSCFASMFKGCTLLATTPKVTIAALTSSVASIFSSMFESTAVNTILKFNDSTIPGGTFLNMYKNCTNIKVSETQSEEYPYVIRFPTEGTATLYGVSNFDTMFLGTGGTFTGTPVKETTYYTDHEPI